MASCWAGFSSGGSTEGIALTVRPGRDATGRCPGPGSGARSLLLLMTVRTAQMTALTTSTRIRVEKIHFKKLKAMLTTITPRKTRMTMPQNDGLGLGGYSGMGPV